MTRRLHLHTDSLCSCSGAESVFVDVNAEQSVTYLIPARQRFTSTPTPEGLGIDTTHVHVLLNIFV